MANAGALLARALAGAATRGFPGEAGVVEALRAEDPWAHSAFRYALAQELCRYLADLGPTFRAVYIYGSTVENRARPASDVDIIVWVQHKTDTVESLLRRLDHLLANGYRTLAGCEHPEHLFDFHLVDDADVELGRGYGAVVRSVWTASMCLWHR